VDRRLHDRLHPLECERAIIESGIPATIQRATQFHELLAMVLGKLEGLPIAPLAMDFRFQPVAPVEVAERITDLAEGAPRGDVPDFGGPEVLTLREIVDVWRKTRGRPRRMIDVRLPGAVAAGYRAGRNTCPDHADGKLRWDEFVAAAAAT
jgi:uncharacterized protein YbjT (DUF2867 family)